MCTHGVLSSGPLSSAQDDSLCFSQFPLILTVKYDASLMICVPSWCTLPSWPRESIAQSNFTSLAGLMRSCTTLDCALMSHLSEILNTNFNLYKYYFQINTYKVRMIYFDLKQSPRLCARSTWCETVKSKTCSRTNCTVCLVSSFQKSKYWTWTVLRLHYGQYYDYTR